MSEGEFREPCHGIIARYTVVPHLKQMRHPAQVAELADALG